MMVDCAERADVQLNREDDPVPEGAIAVRRASPFNRLLLLGQAAFAQEIIDIADGPATTALLVANVQQALQQTRTTPIDMCLIDVDVFANDVSAMVAALKENSPEMEIVAVASANFLGLAIASLRVGSSDILQRPLRGAQLLDALQQAAKRQRCAFTAALYGVTSAVFSAERDALPELIVDSAAKVMGADEASLLLPDGEGRLYVAHSTNPHAVQTAGQSMPMDHCVAGRIAASNPAVLNGGLDGALHFENIPHANRPASSIVYPLQSGETLVGVLTLNRGPDRRPFVQDDVERAGLLARQMAIALDNLRLMRTMASASRLGATGQLAAGMVHEINNPLACILANLELAHTELAPKGEGMQQLLSSAEHGAMRIMEIIRDVRVISRSDEIQPSVFDLSDAVRSALRIAGAQLRRTAAMRLELTPALMIEGNPGQIAEVVLHLVMNAEEAMRSPACERRELKVRSWLDDNHVMLQVTDTGPGIAPTHLSRIFEPFFTTKGGDGHSGLGLSMCRAIVLQHGGALHVDSTLGTGATLTVILPCSPVMGRPSS